MSRLLAFLGLALIFVIKSQWIAFARQARGKEAYLASEARAFDWFYAHPHAVPNWKVLVAQIVYAVLLVGIYELLAFGFYWLICLMRSRDDGTRET